MKYFQVLANELQANKPFFQHYYNIPSIKQRQSSVAIIFRINKHMDWSHIRPEIEKIYSEHPHPQESVCPESLLNKILSKITDNDVEMLFAQRSTHQADFNSGNVCFPGGKSDGSQSDLEACIRQVRQEVGITLLKQGSSFLNVYLGKFKHNFFYRKSRRETIFISCHMFLILNPTITMILNSAEIYDTRWVNFGKVANQTPFIYRSRQNISAINSFPKWLKFVQKSVKNNLLYVEYSAIDVDLGSPLWGLSLHLYMHMMRIICNKLPANESKIINQRIKLGEVFEAKFKWYYPLSYPCQWFVNSWNQKHRIRAFKEPPVKQSRMSFLWFVILVVLIWVLKRYLNY